MQDIARKKQHYFQPITSQLEREDILNQLVTSNILLRIKSEQNKASNALTVIKPFGLNKSSLVGKHEEGPSLSPGVVIVTFDLDDLKFFSKGEVLDIKNGDYIVHLKDIYKLQRRNSFRVDLPELIIDAKFNTLLVNKVKVSKSLRVVNLSAEGVALEVPEEAIGLFDKKATLVGILSVGTHLPIELKASVRFARKQMRLGSAVIFQMGCQFQEMTPALNQKVAFIVNDCHRIIFSRIHK